MFYLLLGRIYKVSEQMNEIWNKNRKSFMKYLHKSCTNFNLYRKIVGLLQTFTVDSRQKFVPCGV